MDDILASIRRILDDDEKTAKAPADGVLMLDRSMIVDGDEPHAAEEVAAGETAETTSAQPEVATIAPLATESETAHSAPAMLNDPTPPIGPTIAREAAPPSLVAPAAAAAAASSVGTLMRTLAAERSAAVGRSGVTIEDLVREEVRPVLKAWLDTHLPPLVERLVQAEIERVVGRNAG